MTRFFLLLAVQKEAPARVGVLTKPCKSLRDADRREEIIIFYCQSLSQPAADSSPYTGEPLGWRAPALYTGEPAGR